MVGPPADREPCPGCRKRRASTPGPGRCRRGGSDSLCRLAPSTVGGSFGRTPNAARRSPACRSLCGHGLWSASTGTTASTSSGRGSSYGTRCARRGAPGSALPGQTGETRSRLPRPSFKRPAARGQPIMGTPGTPDPATHDQRLRRSGAVARWSDAWRKSSRDALRWPGHPAALVER
jgi:hypothetical protein